MTDHQQLTTTPYNPIDGSLLELSQDSEGWRLTVRHRHVGGRFGECGSTYYDPMTLAEALDVIDAEMHSSGHEPYDEMTRQRFTRADAAVLMIGDELDEMDARPTPARVSHEPAWRQWLRAVGAEADAYEIG